MTRSEEAKERNISINKSATLSSITQSILNNIIKGNSKTPAFQTLLYLCYSFNIDLAYFLIVAFLKD